METTAVQSAATADEEDKPAASAATGVCSLANTGGSEGHVDLPEDQDAGTADGVKLVIVLRVPPPPSTASLHFQAASSLVIKITIFMMQLCCSVLSPLRSRGRASPLPPWRLMSVTMLLSPMTTGATPPLQPETWHRQ